MSSVRLEIGRACRNAEYRKVEIDKEIQYLYNVIDSSTKELHVLYKEMDECKLKIHEFGEYIRSNDGWDSKEVKNG